MVSALLFIAIIFLTVSVVFGHCAHLLKALGFREEARAVMQVSLNAALFGFMLFFTLQSKLAPRFTNMNELLPY